MLHIPNLLCLDGFSLTCILLLSLILSPNFSNSTPQEAVMSASLPQPPPYGDHRHSVSLLHSLDVYVYAPPPYTPAPRQGRLRRRQTTEQLVTPVYHSDHPCPHCYLKSLGRSLKTWILSDRKNLTRQSQSRSNASQARITRRTM